MLYGRRKWMAYAFLVPFLAFAIIFLIYPFVSNAINSFFFFRTITDSNPTFVGFENFAKLFTDQYFLVSIGNTFLLIAGVIVFQVGIALVLALLINSLKKLVNFYRITFFIPVVISGTVLGTMYMLFGLSDPTGLFNSILKLFGVSHGSFLPNDNRMASLVYVLIPVIWQCIGFYFVIILTGLTNISEDIMEAAKIDGASGLTATFKITLPMLWNVFRTCMVLAITGALKVFDIPQVVAKGGSPLGFTYFMGTYNSSLFSQIRIGEMAIYSLLIIFVGVFISQISNLVLKENKDIQ